MKSFCFAFGSLALLLAALVISDSMDKSSEAVKAANACQPVLASLLNK